MASPCWRSLARRGDSPPYHVHHTEDECRDFERFVREASRPAAAAVLRPRAGPPTAEQQAAVAELSVRHHIELLGPPLAEELAEAA